jgi:hypothetical protein
MINHERDSHLVELYAVVTPVALSVSRTPLRAFSGRFSHGGVAGNVGSVFVADNGAAPTSLE